MSDLHALREREKELRCLYRVHEILSRRGEAPPSAFLAVLETLPSGWQRPESTGARIEYLGRSYVGPGFSASGALLAVPLRVGGVEIGRLDLSDSTPGIGGDAFLPEETELLRNVATRLGEYLEWKHTELLGERHVSPHEHWRWREAYAEALAGRLDRERFGVERVYVGGSTASGDAAHASDIDLYVLFRGTEDQRRELALWLEGWSLCLAELSLRQTGQAFDGGLLELHWLDAEPDRHLLPSLRELPVLGG